MSATGKSTGRTAKRKAPSDLSSNPHSIRRRKYEESLSPAHKEVKKAVDANRAYRGYQACQFRKTARYLDAPEGRVRDEMLRAYVSSKWAERSRQTATFVRARLGLSLEAFVDDGDLEWETDSEVGEEEEEEILRFAEQESGLEKPEKPEKSEIVVNRAVGQNVLVLLRQWANYWKGLGRSATRKLAMNAPRSAFSTSERLMFKIVAALGGDNEWVELPGPAKVWPNGYNYITSGWDVPIGVGRQAVAFLKELNGYRPSKKFFTILNSLQEAEIAEKMREPTDR
ncbi:MAG: hypothetical protein M1816_004146 [Peltula sp. TS41687]|nr:MAG: hypothetical protein M1816_004146 [Peltula sp. TS41687]